MQLLDGVADFWGVGVRVLYLCDGARLLAKLVGVLNGWPLQVTCGRFLRLTLIVRRAMSCCGKDTVYSPAQRPQTANNEVTTSTP